MKASKGMKSMKSMRMKGKKAMKKSMRMRKAKRVSKIGKGRMAKAMVLRGSKAKTSGGLTASKLKKNKSGKIVSKKASARGQKNKWAIACGKARKALKIKGFCPFGGKTAQGKALLKAARSFYKK